MAINYIAKLLSENNMEVDVLTGKPNYPEGKLIKGYGFFSKIKDTRGLVNIYRVPIIPRGTRFRTSGLIINYLSAVISFSLLAPFILRGKRYDLIFVYGNSPLTTAIPALLLGKIKNVPVILWVQDLWPQSIKTAGYNLFPFLLNLMKSIINFIYQNVDLILCQSKSFIKEIKINYKIDEKKIKLLKNTIDEIFGNDSEINYELLPDKLIREENVFNFLFTGNIGKVQSIKVLINAIRIIEKKKENVNFIIVGGGSQLKKYKEEVARLGLKQIFFFGEHSWESMPSFINFCDALLISLKKNKIMEMTIPNKLQSYLASGKPILGSIDGESAELIINSESGVIVNADDSESLASAAIAMSRMRKEELLKFGENGKKYFEDNFSKNVFIKDIKEYFKGISKS